MKIKSFTKYFKFVKFFPIYFKVRYFIVHLPSHMSEAVVAEAAEVACCWSCSSTDRIIAFSSASIHEAACWWARAECLRSATHIRRSLMAPLPNCTCRRHRPTLARCAPVCTTAPGLTTFSVVSNLDTPADRKSIAQIPLGSSRYVLTRHDTFDVSRHAFWLCRACRTARLETRSSRRARHVERVVSCRDVTWRAKWNLGLYTKRKRRSKFCWHYRQ